jgi:uncharacterized protein involved in oxidation of intracellular sulfur
VQHALFIVNDSPFASEKALNALRLAGVMLDSRPDLKLRIFFMSDGVFSVIPHQIKPEEQPDIEGRIVALVEHGVEISACVVCMKDRGLFGRPVIEGVTIGNLYQLADWVAEADRVLTF